MGNIRLRVHLTWLDCMFLVLSRLKTNAAKCTCTSGIKFPGSLISDQTFIEYSISKLLTNTPINVCKVGCIGEFTGGHLIVKPGCHIN